MLLKCLNITKRRTTWLWIGLRVGIAIVLNRLLISIHSKYCFQGDEGQATRSLNLSFAKKNPSGYGSKTFFLERARFSQCQISCYKRKGYLFWQFSQKFENNQFFSIKNNQHWLNHVPHRNKVLKATIACVHSTRPFRIWVFVFFWLANRFSKDTK